MREPRRIIKHLEAILEAILEASEGHGRAEPAVRVARVKPRVEDGREHSCVPGCAAAEAVARRRGGHARVDVDAESTEMRARRRRGPRVVVAAAVAVVVVRAEGIVRGEIVRVPVVVLVHVVVVVVVVVVFVVRHAAHVAESAALGLAAGAPVDLRVSLERSTGGGVHPTPSAPGVGPKGAVVGAPNGVMGSSSFVVSPPGDMETSPPKPGVVSTDRFSAGSMSTDTGDVISAPGFAPPSPPWTGVTPKKPPTPRGAPP